MIFWIESNPGNNTKVFLWGASMDTQKIAYQEIEALHLPEGVLIGMEFGFGEIKKEPKEVDGVRCTFS